MRKLAFLLLLVSLVMILPANAGVIITKNVVIIVGVSGGAVGKITLLNDQSYATITDYANGTVFFDYRGFEDHQGTYGFTVQSYGNGTVQLRFKGAVPTTVQQSAATSAYVQSAGWQQITYTASQTSGLSIIFNTNPRFSLTAGAYFGASIFVFVIVVRMFEVVQAKSIEERKKIMDQNKTIFLVMGLVVFVLSFFAVAFFP